MHFVLPVINYSTVCSLLKIIKNDSLIKDYNCRTIHNDRSWEVLKIGIFEHHWCVPKVLINLLDKQLLQTYERFMCNRMGFVQQEQKKKSRTCFLHHVYKSYIPMFVDSRKWHTLIKTWKKIYESLYKFWIYFMLLPAHTYGKVKASILIT